MEWLEELRKGPAMRLVCGGRGWAGSEQLFQVVPPPPVTQSSKVQLGQGSGDQPFVLSLMSNVYVCIYVFPLSSHQGYEAAMHERETG